MNSVLLCGFLFVSMAMFQNPAECLQLNYRTRDNVPEESPIVAHEDKYLKVRVDNMVAQALEELLLKKLSSTESLPSPPKSSSREEVPFSHADVKKNAEIVNGILAHNFLENIVKAGRR